MFGGEEKLPRKLKSRRWNRVTGLFGRDALRCVLRLTRVTLAIERVNGVNGAAPILKSITIPENDGPLVSESQPPVSRTLIFWCHQSIVRITRRALQREFNFPRISLPFSRFCFPMRWCAFDRRCTFCRTDKNFCVFCLEIPKVIRTLLNYHSDLSSLYGNFNIAQAYVAIHESSIVFF